MVVEIENIHKSFGDLVVFQDFSLTIPKNEITCIVGPSGCGKTTLLNIICNTEGLDSGSVHGVNFNRISYIFQETRMLPWKTALENIQLVLNDISIKDSTELGLKYLKMVNLEEFYNKYPHQLSGGMKQRVSIARAFAYPSNLILMDEAFKGLDVITKQNILDEFKRIWQNDKRTVIYVTHDIEEALQICDHLILFSDRPVTILNKYSNEDIQSDPGRVKNEIILTFNKKAGV
ncbi:MAG: ABC transporter ATP-binding protein [Bacteroidales bacterium]|nr:ABC transporter ATP-binding protein [Bacteroidales bacterium]